MKLVCITIYTLILSAPVFGQLNTQPDTLSDELIAEKFELFSKSHPAVLLFLHTDKNMYTNNETIWFSAFLVSKDLEPLNAHDVLSVALIKEDDHKAVLQSKYVLASGTGAGSLLLPDTIASGYYQLLAYTNIIDKNSNPVAIFRQEITIKNTSLQNDGASLKSPADRSGDDSIYTLPDVTNNSVAVHINNRVINDTLRFTISSAQSNHVKVLVHNYRQAYSFFEVNTRPKEQVIAIAVNKIPKGVITLAVMDNFGNLLNEQQFFAHYDDRINTIIKTDKPEYAPKEHVTVTVKLTDKNGMPVQGLVSVACVQAARLQPGSTQDIETYVYLDDECSDLPMLAEESQFNNKMYLEKILQLKGLHRYKWQDLLHVSPPDTLRHDHALAFAGNVTNLTGQLNKPLTLAVVSDSGIKVINTDDLGHFVLKNEDLTVRPGRKIWMILNQNNNAGYTIDVNDPYTTINQKLAEATIFDPRVFNRKTGSSQTEVLSDFEKKITLTNVIVKSQNNDHPFYEAKDIRGFNENACGDYACAMYGDLNCPLAYHDLTKTIKPIKGKVYHRLIFNTQGRLIMWIHETYMGCSLEENNASKAYFLPGIYETKVFYGADYKQPESPQSQYLSTLFWSPAIVINNGEATFSFITSDTKGMFNIAVQGLSTSDVLFGESSFMVK